MADQYVATDTRTGLQVAVTGTFPADPEDRVRIARTCTLFTRLMATILAMEETRPRRDGFRAIETQLEVAEALMRGDVTEVQRLLRQTMTTMGVTEEQLRELETQLRAALRGMEGMEGLEGLGDLGPPDDPDGEGPDAPRTPGG
jgi:PAS domain-containing protein